MSLIDIYSDNNQEVLIKIAEDFPNIINRLTEVGTVELQDKSGLTDNAFAWPEEKLYPIYTKEAALLSSVYMEGVEVPAFVVENCIGACAAFGVDVEIGTMEKTAEEESLAASDFVLPGRRKLPVVDASTYTRSEGLFLRNLDDFSIDETIIGAKQLIKKASEIGVSSDDNLQKLSLNGQLNVAHATELSRSRYAETADPEYLSISERLAGQRYSSVEKIAEWVNDLDTADRRNNINTSSAILSVMEPITKEEALLLGNIEIPFEKIAQIDEDEWTDILGRDDVDSLFKEGSLNNKKLVEIILDSSAIEYDILSSFIQNKARS